MAIRVAPLLEDGSPFPTTFWLTCPHLSEAAGAMESAGAASEWAAEVAGDPVLAAAVAGADRDYRAARAALSDGRDPCHGTGVAGQADPLGIKCLHARVAAALAGMADPIGAAVLERIADEDGLECADDRCARASAGADGRMPPGADVARGARRGGRAGRI